MQRKPRNRRDAAGWIFDSSNSEDSSIQLASIRPCQTHLAGSPSMFPLVPLLIRAGLRCSYKGTSWNGGMSVTVSIKRMNNYRTLPPTSMRENASRKISTKSLRSKTSWPENLRRVVQSTIFWLSQKLIAPTRRFVRQDTITVTSPSEENKLPKERVWCDRISLIGSRNFSCSMISC